MLEQLSLYYRIIKDLVTLGPQIEKHGIVLTLAERILTVVPDNEPLIRISRMSNEANDFNLGSLRGFPVGCKAIKSKLFSSEKLEYKQ